MSKTKRILLAEDERAMANVLASKLKSPTCQIDIASDGAEAVKMIEENVYDLVLLDVLMPRVNGFDVLTKLKERDDAPPVLVITNLAQPEDRKKALELGADEYLVKSDSPLHKIKEMVDNLLGC